MFECRKGETQIDIDHLTVREIGATQISSAQIGSSEVDLVKPSTTPISPPCIHRRLEVAVRGAELRRIPLVQIQR